MLLDECRGCISQIESILPEVRKQNLLLERELIENLKLKAQLFNN